MDKRELMEKLLKMQSKMESSPMDDSARERELLRFAGENLDSSQQEKLRSVLRDRQALDEMLRCDQAKALIERLRGSK